MSTDGRMIAWIVETADPLGRGIIVDRRMRPHHPVAIRLSGCWAGYRYCRDANATVHPRPLDGPAVRHPLSTDSLLMLLLEPDLL